MKMPIDSPTYLALRKRIHEYERRKAKGASSVLECGDLVMITGEIQNSNDSANVEFMVCDELYIITNLANHILEVKSTVDGVRGTIDWASTNNKITKLLT